MISKVQEMLVYKIPQKKLCRLGRQRKHYVSKAILDIIVKDIVGDAL